MLTQDYCQPDFYHFSQTTVESAKWVVEILSVFSKHSYYLIDLFAGSGVFSSEIFYRLPQGSCYRWDLVELQREFTPYLEKNISQSNKIKTQIFYQSANDWLKENSQLVNAESVIVLNPPHFFEDEGKLPKNSNKQTCHFIKRIEWMEFIQRIKKTQAQIFILLKLDTQAMQHTITALATKIKIIQPLSGKEVLLYIH